jgi:hypothetical protein
MNHRASPTRSGLSLGLWMAFLRQPGLRVRGLGNSGRFPGPDE